MIRSLVVVISIVVWCSNIYGQDIQTSQMSVDRYKIYSLDSGKVLGGGELDYNVSMNYSRDALVDSYSNIALIKNYNQVNIGGTYGLIGGRLSIGGSVGYNYITGDRGGVISYKSGGDNIRVMPKLRVYSILGVDIGLSVVISVPTDSGVYSNIYRVLISGDSIWKLKDVRWVINIGYKDGGGVVNKSGEVKTNYFGNGMIVGLGVVYKVMGVWDIKGEVKYSGGLGDVIDGIIGFRYDGWLIVGVGQGFTGGIGSVSYRGVVGVEGGVVIKRDKDGDGVMDSVDRCEGDSEDKDGYLDEDGCPDLDNDGDGVMDIYDRCVGEKEVMNGYRDYDGCEDEVLDKVDEIYFVKGGEEVIVGKSYVVLKRVVDMVGEFSRSGKWEVKLEIRCRSRGRGESVGREIKGMVNSEIELVIIEDSSIGEDKVGFRLEFR